MRRIQIFFSRRRNRASYASRVSFAHRLYRHDIAGSIAPAAALASAGILAADEFELARWRELLA